MESSCFSLSCMWVVQGLSKKRLEGVEKGELRRRRYNGVMGRGEGCSLFHMRNARKEQIQTHHKSEL